MTRNLKQLTGDVIRIGIDNVVLVMADNVDIANMACMNILHSDFDAHSRLIVRGCLIYRVVRLCSAAT